MPDGTGSVYDGPKREKTGGSPIGTITGMVGMLAREEVDIAMTGMTLAHDRSQRKSSYSQLRVRYQITDYLFQILLSSIRFIKVW